METIFYLGRDWREALFNCVNWKSILLNSWLSTITCYHHYSIYSSDHCVAGILVDAMRKGYWIILDELNLAPTDVLEALNRVIHHVKWKTDFTLYSIDLNIKHMYFKYFFSCCIRLIWIEMLNLYTQDGVFIFVHACQHLS